GEALAEGQLLDLRTHPEELRIETLEPTRLLLLGGLPLGEPLTMWWNFVGRSREEIATAATDWAAYVDSGASASDVVDRFATVTSRIAPIPAPTLV
ncbi:MAG: pirin-like C-terminal cupin domain-containing protein, partial [Candidatus Nanopelagicales bacterium]